MTERALVDEVEPNAVVEHEVSAQVRIDPAAHAELAGHAKVGDEGNASGVKPQVLSAACHRLDPRPAQGVEALGCPANSARVQHVNVRDRSPDHDGFKAQPDGLNLW